MIYGSSARLPREKAASPSRPWPSDAFLGGKRRSVAARVLASYVLVIMAFTATAGWSIASQRRAAEEAELLRTGYVTLKFSIEEALEAQNLVSAELNHITEVNNPSDARTWIETERRTRPKTFAKIRAVALSLASKSDSRARAIGNDLARDTNEAERFLQADSERFARLFDALASGDSETAQRVQNELVSYEVEGARRLRDLRDRVDREMDDLVSAARSRERVSIDVLALLSMVTLAVGILVSLHTRRVLRPLALVTDRAKAVAQGDLTPRKVIASADEIGELAATFERMVSAIARANADLVQAERLAAIGKMAAHVTHEIRNPLSSMGLNIELLEEELTALPEDGAEARQLVRAIKREIDRLAELSDEYLRMARRPPPSLERDSLGDLMREVVEFTRAELARANVTCHVEIEDELPALAFDEAQIRQALLNLIRNAREALHPSGGELWLRVLSSSDRDGVELVVDDDGAGITEEIREQVFDPFFTTKERGTGLGLALTRQIIEGHGGTIVCEPRLPKGTRFHIHLPQL
jgi:two-component system NtrC family sensor kinase